MFGITGTEVAFFNLTFLEDWIEVSLCDLIFVSMCNN